MVRNLQKNEFARRILVKFLDYFIFVDEEGIEKYEDGAEKHLPDDIRRRWDKLQDAFPGITLKRLYPSVSPKEIQDLVARAEQLDPDYQAPNFLTYFVIDVPLDSDPFELVEELANWNVIQYAYIESLPAPLPTTPSGTNPKIIEQDYLEPPNLDTSGQIDLSAPIDSIGGINATYAWTLSGGAGSGVTFIDIEKAWILNHADLVDPTTTNIKIEHLPLISGTGNVAAVSYCDSNDLDCTAHGTRVLGILAAQDNNLGCVGIAYEATGKVLSAWEPPSAAPTWNIPNAIMTAANNLDFGDVMLLELQVCQTQAGGVCPDGLPNAEKVLLPIELEAANFETVRLATALGIVVVEAAGNGAKDLSTCTDNNREHILDPTSGEAKDSGAILVGAAIGEGINIPSTAQRGTRLPSSNFGQRVNCFAWGNQVTTTSDTVLDPSGYTSAFTGTSAASAIVAGAAVLVQAIAEHRPPPLNFRIGPFQLRDILSDTSTGTESVDPPNDSIGVMPNLGPIITNVLNLVPDVFVRDHVGDTGDPHTGPFSASPDVIVRPASESDSGPDPNTAFGGSSTFYDNTLSSQVIGGQDYDVYVRVLNRGGGAATGTKATVYWSLPSTFATPDSWTKIGTSADPTAVPISTASLTVLDSILWTAPGSGPGQYCFMATIGSDDDPDPVPDLNALAQMDIDSFQEFIRLNNNVALHNFNDVPMVAETGTMEMVFMAPGWLNADLPMWLEVEAHLPTRSRVWLEGPTEFMGRIAGNRRYLEDGAEGVARLPVNPYGVNRFREIVFPAKSQTEMKLRVDIPREERGNTYEIFARQLYHGDEVGRVTWRLVPPNQIQTLPLRFLFSELWNHVRFRLRLGRART